MAWQEKIGFILLVAFLMGIVSAVPISAETTQPTIVSVSPTNNEQDVGLQEPITVTFSEEMNTTTINEGTFTVEQRTTPKTGEVVARTIEGTITYSGRTATFTPKEGMNPNQHYGNVFTATITSGAEDLAGNALARNYVWSFTTGQDIYNTGASTSQTDQSPTRTPSATFPPVTTAPDVATDAQESSAMLPSGWIAVGALLLLLIALALYLLRGKSQRSPRKRERSVSHRPFGDVHEIMALEGIGPTYGKRLEAMGIDDTKQLWEANAAKVAERTGAPIGTVISWQNMAELASIHDIGPQYAELLERSGVHSIEQLKSYKTRDLLRLVRKKQDSIEVNIQGNTPGTALVGNWIKQAHEHDAEGQSA